MDQISYQNGFVCGLAARGLTRSGQLYQPNIYNDSGKYSYFYLDFRRAMEAFSIGMLTESIIVYDSTQIIITGFEKVNETTYKIYANIASLPHGVTVINKKTSRLHFANGDILPPFATHMLIAGQMSYMDGGYSFEKMQYAKFAATCAESCLTLANDAISTGNIIDTVVFGFPAITLLDVASIVLV